MFERMKNFFDIVIGVPIRTMREAAVVVVRAVGKLIPI